MKTVEISKETGYTHVTMEQITFGKKNRRWIAKNVDGAAYYRKSLFGYLIKNTDNKTIAVWTPSTSGTLNERGGKLVIWN